MKTIDTQTIEIRELTKTVYTHESTIFSLKEIITKKEDVEAQLATCRDDNSKLF